MQVGKNKVISLHYQLFNEAGDKIESTLDSHPTLFLVGAGNMLAALEQALLGKTTGDKLTVNLEPYQAFGERQHKQQRISAKYLKHEGKLVPGKVVRLNSDQGVRMATVIKVGKFNVDVDLNHPLAGQRVCFEVEITDIREASNEEIAHGHAHGEGGHQH